MWKQFSINNISSLYNDISTKTREEMLQRKFEKLYNFNRVLLYHEKLYTFFLFLRILTISDEM